MCLGELKVHKTSNCFFGFFAFLHFFDVTSSAVGMWESQAAFLPDFSKRLREATRFVAFRKRVISTAGLVALC